MFRSRGWRKLQTYPTLLKMEYEDLRARLAAQGTEPDFRARWLAGLLTRLNELKLSGAALGSLLGYSDASALRRRLRGEAPFPAFEMVRLSQVLSVPLPIDPPVEVLPTLKLSLAPGQVGRFDGDLYMNTLLGLTREIGVPTQDRGQARLQISTTDLPFFVTCGHPILAAVKLFFLEGGGGQLDTDFSFEDLRVQCPAYFEGASELAAFYGQTDTDEVWGGAPLYSSLSEVLALTERRALSPRDAHLALGALTQLSHELRQAAKTGRKTGGGRLRLASHDLAARVMTAVAIAPNVHLSLHTLRGPHYMVSRDSETAAILLELFEDLRAAARPINGRAPFGYRLYTDAMLTSIAETRAVIDAAA